MLFRSWLHAGFADGAPFTINLGGDIGDKRYVSGSLFQVGAGIEARRCSSASLILCAALGIDVGYKKVTYDDMDVTNPSSSSSFHYSSGIVTPRLQLDVGGDRVRARPTLEWQLGSGVSTFQFLMAAAIQI